jgi:hypothetical protein
MNYRKHLRQNRFKNSLAEDTTLGRALGGCCEHRRH